MSEQSRRGEVLVKMTNVVIDGYSDDRWHEKLACDAHIWSPLAARTLTAGQPGFKGRYRNCARK